MEVLATFPRLIPIKVQDTGTVYDGYLTVNGEDYRVRITTSYDSGSLKDIQFDCEWRLKHLLADYHEILEQRRKNCKDLCSYLKEIISVAECVVDREPVPEGGSEHCNRVIEELEKMGWDKFSAVDASFHNLTLQCEDSGGRQHKLIVQLSSQEAVAPQCVSDLPGKFVFQWNAKSHLSELMKQFEATLNRYQALWDALMVVDSKTWVLEPDPPTFSACSRRIALSPGTSLQITVDPRHPTSMPQCCFLGADQVISPLKDKLNSNIHKWDVNSSLVNNLETLLEISFPSPSNSKKEDFSLDCGICYNYRLGNEIPEKACDDAHCGQTFHHSCLYEWMRSVPTCQQSFNTIFGECPFCSKPITIKVPIK